MLKQKKKKKQKQQQEPPWNERLKLTEQKGGRVFPGRLEEPASGDRALHPGQAHRERPLSAAQLREKRSHDH